LHEQDEVASFPSEGCQWVKLDVFRGFWCRGRNGFSHSFFFVLMSVLFVGVKVLFVGVEVSSIIEVKVSRYRFLSEYRGVKVSGCTVKIRAWSLVSLHFC
jgi:hypothetical protein